MAQENVEQLARGIMDLLSSRDAARVNERADPDVEWHSFFAVAEEGAYRGYEGTERFMADLSDAWETVRAEVDDGLAVEDLALLVGRIHYRGRGSGVETESPAGWLLKFRNGRVVYFRAFRKPAEALAAVGLSE